MSAYPVSRAVRDAIRERLADPAEGFAAVHAALAGDYGVAPITIDFGPASRQFYEGAIDIDDVLGSAAARRPVMVLYTQSSANTVAQVGPLFSGQVVAIIAMHLQQRGGNAVRNYEAAADAVEETLYRLFLSRQWTRDPALTFGGDMSVARGPVIPADSDWRQTITARLVFGVHTD